jgi:hypothetical protein
MANDYFFESHDWHSMDFFQIEAEHFERDVYILILGTLRAAVAHIDEETNRDDAEIKKDLDKAQGEAAEWLVEKQIELWSDADDQKRFQRNLCLVGLMTRLTHTLKRMARSAETFSPTDKKGYGERNDDEFKKLWAEYRSRFGIDFNARYIQFVEPLRKARNQIVHNGGDAPDPISISEIDLEKGDEGFYDPKFMKKYPHFVQAEGSTAVVNIREDQLNSAIDSSVKLIKHAAEVLRAAELAAVKKK